MTTDYRAVAKELHSVARAESAVRDFVGLLYGELSSMHDGAEVRLKFLGGLSPEELSFEDAAKAILPMDKESRRVFDASYKADEDYIDALENAIKVSFQSWQESTYPHYGNEIANHLVRICCETHLWGFTTDEEGRTVPDKHGGMLAVIASLSALADTEFQKTGGTISHKLTELCTVIGYEAMGQRILTRGLAEGGTLPDEKSVWGVLSDMKTSDRLPLIFEILEEGFGPPKPQRKLKPGSKTMREITADVLLLLHPEYDPKDATAEVDLVYSTSERIYNKQFEKLPGEQDDDPDLAPMYGRKFKGRRKVGGHTSHHVPGTSMPQVVMDHFAPGKQISREEVHQWLGEHQWTKKNSNMACMSRLKSAGFVGSYGVRQGFIFLKDLPADCPRPVSDKWLKAHRVL